MTHSPRAVAPLIVPAQRQSRAPRTSAPRSLPGSVLITRNRTSAASQRTLSFAPTKAQMAAILAGEHLAHDLLAAGMPDSLLDQADAIARVIDPIIATYDVRRLEKRGVQFAEAAARHFINHCQPATLVLASRSHLTRWHDEHGTNMAELDVLDGEAPTAPETVARLLGRPRLAWTHPAGPRDGLLLDRFHHTHQRGAIERDTWMRRKVAEDLTSIHELLTSTTGSHPAHETHSVHPAQQANLGVRVHTHRAPNVGIHFLPDYTTGNGAPVLGAHHRVGGCEHCAARRALPNTSTSTGTGVQA
ncbi:hypothetical protein NOCD_04805 [Nocardioides cavernae]|uniref:hypothetical protein n=1 Tax=Nocardioides TaxID=1839 RepID=UPI000AE41393|nr:MULTISPECIES: hypothetical protein [Nocardioides]MCK9822797.1 hypothetical protein [Nocardioides cavernae]